MMAKNHEIYIFWITVIISLCQAFFLFNPGKIIKSLLFYIEYFILIYSLFI